VAAFVPVLTALEVVLACVVGKVEVGLVTEVVVLVVVVAEFVNLP
jgi:hypothetical protein